MNTTNTYTTFTEDELITEAILREKTLTEFYEHAMFAAGFDAQKCFSKLFDTHLECLLKLEHLQDEITIIRETETPIAD
ncbi:MAG: hypothetical protein FJ218_06160 [Ignavibacteria bacterium]|nr:hypothetical protein [Ignavibacteria bacterium]